MIQCFRWVKCKVVLFRSQLQLTWVKTGDGDAVVVKDWRICNETRSVLLLSHDSAWEDIGDVTAQFQALKEVNEPQSAHFVSAK
jgi:hypothetical protein